MKAKFTLSDKSFELREIDFAEYADLISPESFLIGLLNKFEDNKIEIEDGSLDVVCDYGEIKITKVCLNKGVVEFSDGERNLHWYEFPKNSDYNNVIKEALMLYNASVRTMMPRYSADTLLTTTEWCSECDTEVEIKANFQTAQVCPNCGKPIRPCSMCFMDSDSCQYCPFTNIICKKQ